MGQYASEFNQQQPTVVNEQALERLGNEAGEVGSATTLDFGGYEPFVDEVVIARFLHVTPRRVLEMARAGEIPAHPIGRGARKTWRFRVSEIDAHFSTPRGLAGATLNAAVPRATRRKQ